MTNYQETPYQKVQVADINGNIVSSFGGSSSGGTDTGSGATTSATTRVVAATDSPDVAAIGTQGDAAASTDTGSSSLIGLIKRLLSVTLAKGQALMAGSLPVVIASNQSAIPVTGNVGVNSLPPLPTGSNSIGAISNTGFTATQSGNWNITNIAGTVSLPTGAATSAKQPALGIAGTPSSDVLSVQGITNGISLKVDGSGVTQPVSLSTFPPLSTGTNVIGAVSQSGTWTIGLANSSNTIGAISNTAFNSVQQGSWNVGLISGSNMVGYVGVTSLPSLPTGSNTIGNVNVSGLPASISNRLPVDLAATTALNPTNLTVTLTNANTEYSQTISNARILIFKPRPGTADIRYAFATGKVAASTDPYNTLQVGYEKGETFPAGFTYSGTLYLASATAGTQVEIEVWS